MTGCYHEALHYAQVHVIRETLIGIVHLHTRTNHCSIVISPQEGEMRNQHY